MKEVSYDYFYENNITESVVRMVERGECKKEFLVKYPNQTGRFEE